MDLESLCRRVAASVGGADVDADQITMSALGHTGGAADQLFSRRSAGQRDQDALARLPCGVDAVLVSVVGKGVVDAVGDPQQCEFAQGLEIAGAEIVGQCGVDLLGCVDVAVGHSTAQ